MTDRDSILQEMIDHHEIRKMLSVYCHGCDRGNGPVMASVYLEDSWDDHGPYKGPGPGYAARLMGIFKNTGAKTTHLLGQSLINLKGDEAGAETCFLAAVRKIREEGPVEISLVSGRWIDMLVREPDGWKIKKRTAVHDWTITLDVENDTHRDSGF